MTPYEPDSATVLLMHFDGDFNNASTLGVADGYSNGESYAFTQSGLGSEFGSMLYLNNAEENDTTGVLVPDHDLLDLTGDWTIEAWVNILTYGESTDDWRWRPRILNKPNADQNTRYNYNLLARGDFRSLRGNYRANADSVEYSSDNTFGWLDTDTSPNSFQSGTWYHLTFFRDSEQHITGLMLHDENGNFIEFASRDYDPEQHAPPTTTEAPLNIGMTKQPDGSFANAFVDGTIDEIRVSNVIRTEFNTPPILSEVTRLANVPSDEPAEVTATAKILPGSEIDEINIMYNAGNGWQSAPMTQGDSLWRGTIPSQPSGTNVAYYVSGTAVNGLSAAAPNGVNPERGPYMNFAFQDTGKVVDLTFEGGELPPATNSTTGAELNWTVGGEPQVVDEGANGTSHSVYFEGDSSHLSIGPDSGDPDYQREADAAVMKNDNFALDFWFKADSLPSSTVRMIIKEGQDRGVYSDWNDFNYQVWTPGGGSVIPASHFEQASEAFVNVYNGNVTGFDTTMTPNQWYRVVYAVKSADTTFSQLYDADNNLLEEHGAAMDVRVTQSNGPLRIGAFSPALDDSEFPFGQPDGPLYQGWIDELKFYNYVPGKYMDSTGTSISEPGELPKQVSLNQNYPNPFNPTTKISYNLPRSAEVTLQVYDVLGRQVAELVDKEQQAGSYTVNFDASQLSSGVYFYRLETKNVKKVRKMMLIK